MRATELLRGEVSASIALGFVSGLIWLLVLGGVADLHSDPIGRGLAAIHVVALWSLLTIMTAIASLKGNAPRLTKVLALVIVPVSGFVAMAAMDLLWHADRSPFLWPIVILVVVPPLAVTWCFLVLLGRSGISRIVGALPVAILAVCLLMEPLSRMRNTVEKEAAVRLAKFNADLARVPANAPIWDWTPFLYTPDGYKRSEVVHSIRSLDQRQAQAETMLDRGDFPIGDLSSFDLDPTPALCDKARSLLRRRVAPLVLKTADSRPSSDIARSVSDAIDAMTWLVGYECSCDAEAVAWETMAKGYRDPNYELYRLAKLRDPNLLGQTLRERPARFSMLGPRSHLKAWLRFTDDNALRDQALAGARKLDRRTDEAVEILSSKYDEDVRWRLVRYLGELDLEATAPLCTTALSDLHRQFTQVYRPDPNDKRLYSELLERLGGSAPLPALIWLAGHGCAADAELKEAIALVDAYRDSPGRAEMLATLTQLQR
ncbi:hypothetical protein [Bradyrhizobium sp. CCGUVB23]|uniref:hypothetical protein n=1 Tax=Bradyrhizobium sp. CCGUVB23 TaxID=2949630 RepID=UPI0020B3C17F|nr:hypothetical protein [Bradyrhizobium sp. CCGUVB23]MCP3459010.1 hypothetical protein [Bradyrhizobium sp. CCGUVB23]